MDTEIKTLQALCAVMRATYASLDLNTVLNNALSQVMQVLNAEVGTIHLVDSARGQLRIVAAHGLPATQPSRLEAWPPKATPPPCPIAPEGVCISAPLQAGGQYQGLLTVGRAGVIPFEANAAALLESLAVPIGEAVHNAHRYSAERARRQQADTLLQVAAVVSSSLELNEVLPSILDQLCRVISCTNAAIQLLQDGALHTVAAQGKPSGPDVPFDPAYPHWHVITQEDTFNLDQGRAAYPAFSHPLGWLGAPLWVGEEVVGLIALERALPEGYTEEDVRLITGFADLTGLALENARLYRQAEQLAVIRERQRLARELHDSVTQSLYSLTLLTEAARRLARTGDLARVEEALTRLSEIDQQALKEMRLLVYELRPLALKHVGLVGALQQRLDTVEKRAGVETHLLLEGPMIFPEQMEEELYRIAQEALNNALKHATATVITVRIHTDDAPQVGAAAITLTITDNGKGFNLDETTAAASGGDTGGIGLDSMRERAEKLGGDLTVHSTPGKGTTVQLVIPASKSAPPS
jgi:signal transduction histidine kinase